jgi:hypothetical protein
MSITTSTTPRFSTTAGTIRARRAAGHARRRLRSEWATTNTPTVRNELQAIVNHYPSELVDESEQR